MLRDERPSARLHLLQRDGSHFPPIELPAGVDIPDLDDAHRREAALQLRVSQQLLYPRLGIFQGLALQVRGQVVVQLGDCLLYTSPSPRD